MDFLDPSPPGGGCLGGGGYPLLGGGTPPGDFGFLGGAGITMERLTIDKNYGSNRKCNTLKDIVFRFFRWWCFVVSKKYKGSRLAGSFVVGLVVS